jgi:uncharacterized membrane protein YkvA (DUF1232 family)
VTGRIWFDVIFGSAAALLLSWLVLVIILVIRRPNGDLLKESLRLLPDLLRLLRRLTTNRDIPTGVRVRVALLFVYLAIPIDVIPDFIPILGYAEDAIIVVLVLRSVCRRLSLEELRAVWPGTDDGFAALCQLIRPSGGCRAGSPATCSLRASHEVTQGRAVTGCGDVHALRGQRTPAVPGAGSRWMLLLTKR